MDIEPEDNLMKKLPKSNQSHLINYADYDYIYWCWMTFILYCKS